MNNNTQPTNGGGGNQWLNNGGLNDVGGLIAGLSTGFASIYNSVTGNVPDVNVTNQAPYQAPPPKDNTMLYVGIGGGVLLLLMLLFVLSKK